MEKKLQSDSYLNSTWITYDGYRKWTIRLATITHHLDSDTTVRFLLIYESQDKKNMNWYLKQILKLPRTESSQIIIFSYSCINTHKHVLDTNISNRANIHGRIERGARRGHGHPKHV